MTLFDLVIKEYLSIIGELEINIPVSNNRIIVEREFFRKILGKYQYMTFKDKTKIYKELNLIIHDKNNYTMPCKVEGTKKTVRKVVINYEAYQTIKKLYETKIK